MELEKTKEKILRAIEKAQEESNEWMWWQIGEEKLLKNFERSDKLDKFGIINLIYFYDDINGYLYGKHKINYHHCFTIILLIFNEFYIIDTVLIINYYHSKNI